MMAPTAEGMILSYAPAPRKIGTPATFLAASLFTAESASYSESTGGKSSSPSSLGETSAKRSSKDSAPIASSISRTSSSVCGVNRATRLYPLFRVSIVLTSPCPKPESITPSAPTFTAELSRTPSSLRSFRLRDSARDTYLTRAFHLRRPLGGHPSLPVRLSPATFSGQTQTIAHKGCGFRSDHRSPPVGRRRPKVGMGTKTGPGVALVWITGYV